MAAIELFFPIRKILLSRGPRVRYLPDREDSLVNASFRLVTRVANSKELGAVVRLARQAAKLDQVKAAGLAGVGPRFFGDIERGKPNLRLGLVLKVLDRLGLEIWIAPRGFRPREP